MILRRSAINPDLVVDMMRGVAQTAILPRYRKLQDADIAEKAPDELVTIADRHAEQLLVDGLTQLLAGSLVVGEESAASLGDFDGLLRSAPNAWLVDPLDGTGNFVAGREEFAMMVALVQHGETVAAWILHPLTGEIAMAERGGGAYWNGQKILASGAFSHSDMHGAILKRFLPPAMRIALETRAKVFASVSDGSRCAGRDYPQMALGHQHFTLYWRTEPWDHAAGALFLEEAGGRVARPDGAPYQPGDRREGLLAVSNGEAWEGIARALFDLEASADC